MKKLFVSFLSVMLLSSLFSVAKAQIINPPGVSYTNFNITVAHECTYPVSLSAISNSIKVVEMAYSSSSTGIPMNIISNPATIYSNNIMKPYFLPDLGLFKYAAPVPYECKVRNRGGDYYFFTIYVDNDYTFTTKPINVKTQNLFITIGDNYEVSYKYTSK